jgi:hypothetical protein
MKECVFDEFDATGEMEHGHVLIFDEHAIPPPRAHVFMAQQMHGTSVFSQTHMYLSMKHHIFVILINVFLKNNHAHGDILSSDVQSR